MILRPYQVTLENDVEAAWQSGAKNVLMRLDTGGGKTAIVSNIVNRHVGASAVIAHRQELVSQLSMTLAVNGVYHNLIAAQSVRRAVAALHIAEHGRSYFNPGALCSVCSIDTLIRAENITAWAGQVTKWVVDEAHHVVNDNKWHRGLKLFSHPLCQGLGPTATPKRADGKGLGRHADGVFDVMVSGPPMRELINEGWLTDYKIVCPESDLELLVEVGASGDWSSKQMREAAKRSHIVGDVVAAYLKFAKGKRGITFATDVDTAGEITAAFRAAGVRAEVLTGDTEGGWRRQILKALASGGLDMIVAVDIVSEGFDLPAVEVGILARPTQSLGVYMQQFGRVLRPIFAAGFDLSTKFGRLMAIAASGKTHALIIDMVANTIRHQGPPDKPRLWSLDRRDKRGGGGDGIPLRRCGEGHTRESMAAIGREPCYQPFERFWTECPYCAYPLPEPKTGGRSHPAAVDGDLAEMDAETLARLRGDVISADQSIDDYKIWLVSKNVTDLIYRTQIKHHEGRQLAQRGLRNAMESYVRNRLTEGLKDRQIHKAFFLTFGIDVLSARALGRADAEELTRKVINHG